PHLAPAPSASTLRSTQGECWTPLPGNPNASARITRTGRGRNRPRPQVLAVGGGPFLASSDAQAEALRERRDEACCSRCSPPRLLRLLHAQHRGPHKPAAQVVEGLRRQLLQLTPDQRQP